MTILGYGITPYGLGSYGGAPTALNVVRAWATSTHTIAVELNAAAIRGCGFLDGDAWNPRSWKVEQLSPVGVYTILAVRDLQQPTQFEILLQEALGPYSATQRVTAVSVKAAGGYALSPPKYADCPGVADVALASPLAQSKRRFQQRDIANPPLPVGSNSVGGTLIVGANGDYVNEEGADLVKKLILRRLFSTPGDFFHLPKYGLGLALKEPVAADLVQLRTEIERQCEQEPEVELAVASLTLDEANNALYVSVQAKLRPLGESIEVATTIPLGVVL
jgi:hypothetical protein